MDLELHKKALKVRFKAFKDKTIDEQQLDSAMGDILSYIYTRGMRVGHDAAVDKMKLAIDTI